MAQNQLSKAAKPNIHWKIGDTIHLVDCPEMEKAAAALLGKKGGKKGGKIGGRSRSEAKLAAARANGKNGGKPKTYEPTIRMTIKQMTDGMVWVDWVLVFCEAIVANGSCVDADVTAACNSAHAEANRQTLNLRTISIGKYANNCYRWTVRDLQGKTVAVGFQCSEQDAKNAASNAILSIIK